MMINKRLIGTVAESKRYIAGNVILQWCSLAANIAMMFSITHLFASRSDFGDTLSLHHWGQPDELPFLQSSQENPAGENL